LDKLPDSEAAEFFANCLLNGEQPPMTFLGD
jgi:hypothetical protein